VVVVDVDGDDQVVLAMVRVGAVGYKLLEVGW